MKLITNRLQLSDASREIAGEPAVALDTESNSRFRYPEQLCLVQMATSRQVYIVDPLAFREMGPLRELLEDSSILKVLHGADYDVRCVDRAWGFRITNLYDTSVAARFAGYEKTGLASITESLLGIMIERKQKFQRADWGRRPLPPDALEYAAGDVRHLLSLREKLDDALRSSSRDRWVAEEFARLEAIRYESPDPNTAFLKVKGSRALDRNGLALLRSLFQFRERIALRLHRPPGYLLKDESLVYLAAQPKAQMGDVPGLDSSSIRRIGDGLRLALREAERSNRLHGNHGLPAHSEHIVSTKEQQVRLRDLKSWRSHLGKELALEASILWPTASLVRLAHDPESLKQEIASPDVRSWQRDEFADSLRSKLATLP